MTPIMRNSKFFCPKCGSEEAVKTPIEISEFSKMGKAFAKKHSKCKQTWKPKEIIQDSNINDRMNQWLASGERGISSDTLFEKLSGRGLGSRYKSHPLDPNDFRRCYLLLKLIPEWKNDLDKLREINYTWDQLVNNWDKLTEMLEEQLSTKKPNGMFEFMLELQR